MQGSQWPLGFTDSLGSHFTSGGGGGGGGGHPALGYIE